MKGRDGIRVLVVDDSPHARQVLRRILEADSLVDAVEGAGNGRIALERAVRKPPDLVILDLEMPVMDGFTFLRFFRTRSRAPVLVVSSFDDLANVEKSLELGASGFVSKPADPYRNLQTIEEELRLKLRQQLGPALGPQYRPVSPPPTNAATEARGDFPIVALGSSSGGPPTLQYLLSGLPRELGAAVLIAQHLPAGFTQTLAKRLDSLLPHTVREARNSDPIRSGVVLVSPGGRHLTVSEGAPFPIAVVEPPGQALYVPSVDRLFETAARVFGERLIAVVLTGMGKDGAAGVRTVKERGGRVIAQSIETAAAHGMPREAAATGCVDEVLPLPALAVRLIQLTERSFHDTGAHRPRACHGSSGSASKEVSLACSSALKPSPMP